MDLHQLNTYLLDSTVPALLLVAVGYVAGRARLVARDAVPFAGVLALIALMFFYWHRDVFYGPRFLYSVAPWFIILLARSLVLLRRAAARGDGGLGLTAAFACLVVIATGLASITPGRLLAYARSTPVFGMHPARDATHAGIHH